MFINESLIHVEIISVDNVNFCRCRIIFIQDELQVNPYVFSSFIKSESTYLYVSAPSGIANQSSRSFDTGVTSLPFSRALRIFSMTRISKLRCISVSFN